MKPNYKPLFVSFVKKQRKPLQLAIEDAVEEVCNTPAIGEAKTGDLQGIRVYKFVQNRQQYLIAYRPPTVEQLEANGADIELLFIDFYQVGVHENFYTALKKYLKS
ncbi:type II toxin-antitoxin system RelE/ParE family toxin [Janthinobacterium sp. RB2R34]|uniref:type II toxin-antitoxin system RelE/ParE family toxin n=1 Tax=Janthinobacterium sp. RB2R34 TaxID=3424193 RepID=UPI003F27F156